MLQLIRIFYSFYPLLYFTEIMLQFKLELLTSRARMCILVSPAIRIYAIHARGVREGEKIRMVNVARFP